MKSTGDRDATTLKIREIGGEALPSIRGAMCYPQVEGIQTNTKPAAAQIFI